MDRGTIPAGVRALNLWEMLGVGGWHERIFKGFKLDIDRLTLTYYGKIINAFHQAIMVLERSVL